MAEVLNNDIKLTERYKSHLFFDDASAVYFSSSRPIRPTDLCCWLSYMIFNFPYLQDIPFTYFPLGRFRSRAI